MAQPSQGPALAPLVGRGFARAPAGPSPTPLPKLQPAMRERSSGRGVDEFSGFKLVLGSWRKKQNKTTAETWQGTGLQPQRPKEMTAHSPPQPHHHGDTAPVSTRRPGGRGEEEEEEEDEDKEGAPAQPPAAARGRRWLPVACTPTSPSLHALLIFRSKLQSIFASPSGRLGLISPSTETEGLEAMPASRTAAVPGPAAGRDASPCLPDFTGTEDTQRGKMLPYAWYRWSPRLLHWRTSFTASKLPVHYLCLT